MVVTTGKKRLSPGRKQWLRMKQLERGNTLSKRIYSTKKSYPRQDYEYNALKNMGTQSRFKNLVDKQPGIGMLSRRAYLLTANRAQTAVQRIRRNLAQPPQAWSGKGMYRVMPDGTRINITPNTWKEEDLALVEDPRMTFTEKMNMLTRAQANNWGVWLADKNADQNRHGTSAADGWRKVSYNDAEFALRSISGGQMRIKVPGSWTYHINF